MAATGTPTPNIGLRIPLGTDPASVDDINYNSNLIDTKLGAVGNDSVQDQIDALNSNLGSPSSASAVTGADAFSKINSLNGKLNSYIYAVNATINLGNIPINNYKDGYVDIDTAQGYNHLLLIPQYTSVGMPIAGTYVGTGAAAGKTRIVAGINNTKGEALSNVTATVRVVFYL